MSALSHILAAEPDDAVPSPLQTSHPLPPATPIEQPLAPMPASRKRQDRTEDDTLSTPKAESSLEKDLSTTIYTSTNTSTRRNASGNTSSVFSGNKIRHLKKDDGVPLWRKDIQFDFLKLVFDDDTRCFTKYSDGTHGHTFASIYIDAMAKSSKCSKVLKEKLLADELGAVSMGMVCLLVNVGRMNTTLNFFPEMRAQLRTYHSIPALQAHQEPNAYKQLQDAPRLKSILKGATEDEPQPSTIEEIRDTSRPRTNPVNLLFVLSQFAPKVSEQHFPPPRDFFDLIMRPSLSSASRAKAFLWLIWWYLESDFSTEDSLKNPFGPGQYGEDEEGNQDALPIRVPQLESLTEAQAESENVDTEEEKHFGEVKSKERTAILASEPSPAMIAQKRVRKERGLMAGHSVHASDDEASELGWSKHPTSAVKAMAMETGSDYTRSPSPATSRGFQAVNAKPAADMHINSLLNSDDVGPDHSPPQLAPAPPAVPVKKGPGRGNWRRKTQPKAEAVTPGAGRSAQETSHHVPLLPNTGQLSFVSDGPQHIQPATPGSGAHYNTLGSHTLSPNHVLNMSHGHNRDHVPTPSYQAQKRHRGITQHQSAVISHRRQQIDYQLDRRIRKIHIRARYIREAQSAIVRSWKRLRMMPPQYDSEEESIKIRKARDRAERNEDDWRSVHRGKEANDDFLDNVDLWRRPRVLYAGFVRATDEATDVGEEVRTMAKTFRRARRRLDRWEETCLPGDAMMRRIELEQQGYLRPRRRRSEMEQYHPQPLQQQQQQPGPVRAGIKRRRSGTARMSERRDVDEAVKQEQEEMEPDDDDGGGELDEEDRELLGEVDADEEESEPDDEDEEMED